MFDLTKKIKLDPEWQKKYIAARVFLHLVFFMVILYVAYTVLFPTVSSDFDFHNVASSKNTIDTPAISRTLVTNGKIYAAQRISFDTNPRMNYADGTFNITLDANSADISGTTITARKSYESFFYPEGAPVGFKNGSLIAFNGQYYIVSQGLLRKFADEDVLVGLGFSKDSFAKVLASDLQYNSRGSDIIDATTYPDDSLITTGDNFYQFENGQLMQFISKQAFLSQYRTNQAIVKTPDFFAKYQISQTNLGYTDGTLASSDISVFILSKGRSYPISNAATFVSMGFDWNSVIPVGSDELGLYERQKQFTDKQPHPDGTIMIDQKTQRSFIIENGFKRPFESDAIKKTYLTITPIAVDMESLTKTSSCTLKSKLFSRSIYSCTLDFSDIKSLPGNDYQIDIAFKSNSSLSSMNVTFYSALTWPNMRNSLSGIKQQLFSNYGIQSPAQQSGQQIQ